MTNYRFVDEKGEHAHLLNDRPLIGTSSVVGVLAKVLTWWASGLAVAELGWQNPKLVPQEARLEGVGVHLLAIKDMDAVQYLALLDKAYAAHSKSLKKSATKGTDMHEELEKYIKLMIADQDGKPMLLNSYEHPAVEIFAKWATENVEKFLISEGYTYSERLWVGGIVDAVAVLKNGQRAIVDFKSSKEAYDSQFMQTAGYDIEIEESGLYDKDGNNLFLPGLKADVYIVFPFGAEKVEPQLKYNVDEYRKGFEACTVLYKITNK